MDGKADLVPLCEAQPGNGTVPLGETQVRGRGDHQSHRPSSGVHHIITPLHQWGGEPIFEAWRELRVELDLAFEALDLAGEDVWRVDPQIVSSGAFSHEQGLPNLTNPFPGLVGRTQDQGAVLVGASDSFHAPRVEGEVAGVFIEDAGKDRWAVESGSTPPLDGAFAVYESSRMTVAE